METEVPESALTLAAPSGGGVSESVAGRPRVAALCCGSAAGRVRRFFGGEGRCFSTCPSRDVSAGTQ
eukprot:1196256-Prorocentrum_minimum.AAC.3